MSKPILPHDANVFCVVDVDVRDIPFDWYELGPLRTYVDQKLTEDIYSLDWQNYVEMLPENVREWLSHLEEECNMLHPNICYFRILGII